MDSALSPFSVEDLFPVSSQSGALLRAIRWSETPLGPVNDWPQSLKTSVSICLNSAFPILIWWGPDLVMLYNDAYAPLISSKHPDALGKRGIEVFPEIWQTIGPMLDGVLQRAQAVRANDLLLFLERNGYPEECYFTFSYSPILEESGGIGGVFTPVHETTERVINERRLKTLSTISDLRTEQVPDAPTACRQVIGALEKNTIDLPFAAIYFFDAHTGSARRVAAYETCCDQLAPEEVPPGAEWPPIQPLSEGQTVVRDLGFLHTGALPRGYWNDEVRQSVLLPLKQPGSDATKGFLLTALNPRKKLDESYASFLALVTEHLSGAIADAEAFETERKRAEALAEIDRAKTVFFSNISHEFRTPLTLIAGPLQEALSESGLSQPIREKIEVAQRSAMRLQKLVNNLLDFSRIEAGRAQAAFQSVDLVALTRDLVSSFESAFAQAGLWLTYKPAADMPLVFVDPDQWEKIVLNLLSNAFKFTLSGGVTVELSCDSSSVCLIVQDTGAGIPASQIQNVFLRFHRVEGAVGRSFEGSGIGLALVHELVKLHHGAIAVDSQEGVGSRFSVRIPIGVAPLPAEVPPTRTASGANADRVEAFVAEALRWIPDGSSGASPLAGFLLDEQPAVPRTTVPELTGRKRVLVADDNQDMRQFLERLLGTRFHVESASNGAEALASIRRLRPDLVLSDVMMPIMDGAQLVQAIRSDPATASIPIILLSARAGEEAQIEGIETGADDYLTKPFSTRELLARITSTLRIAEIRAAAEQALRASEQELRHTIEFNFQVPWTADPEGRITDFSHRWLEITGLTREQALDDGWRRVQHPADLERVAAAWRHAVETGEALDIEHRVLTSQGGYHWMRTRAVPRRDESGNILKWYGTAEDIHDRKRAEEAIRERDAQLREVLERTTDAVFLLDSEWRFQYLNVHAKNLIAAERELLGKNIWEEFPDAIERSFYSEYHRARDQKIAVQFEEYYPAPLDMWLEVHAYPTADGLAVFFRDITLRRKSEAALRQSEKLAAAGRLAASIAHEINNPLEAVTNLLYLLDSNPSLNPQAREFLDLAQKELARVSHIANQTLRFYRQSTNPTEVRLDHVLDSVVDLHLLRHPHSRVQFERQYRPAPAFKAFEGELRQVFGNLIANANDALGEGGRIVLRVRPSKDWKTGVPGIRGTVADNGQGMTRDTLHRLFEPFFSTKGMVGTGLGLWVSREIVEKHGGRMRVRSSMQAPRRGTTFSVFLPLHAAH